MIYTAIDTFYLTDEQLQDSPSRKDDIDEATETLLRVYGCELIQESGILLRLPQAVMATGQVLFHRFYCKKSFAQYSVKRVAASCVWLASKLEESPRRAKHVILVFNRMECRRENLPIELFDVFSEKYAELKNDLIKMERHLLKEMGFVCHVEHPHKFISNYLETFVAPIELRQEAWNLANDSLRTTLCVRFKSEVVACGVVYAAARRFRFPLPEDPPWWVVFDADDAAIQEVCRVLAHLYSLPKAQYIPVYKKKDDSFTSKGKLTNGTTDGKTPEPSNDAVARAAGGENLKELKENREERTLPTDLGNREDPVSSSKIERSDGERVREKEKDRVRGRERDGRSRDSDRDRDHDREGERDRERHRKPRSEEKTSGHSEKSRHRSSRDRDYYGSHSSRDREKDRHRHR